MIISLELVSIVQRCVEGACATAMMSFKPLLGTALPRQAFVTAQMCGQAAVPLSEGASLYLDVFRFCSAMVVLVFHSSYRAFGGQYLTTREVGIDAVMAFFVLSGLMMAMLVSRAAQSHAAYGAYVRARLARLWSVLLPALALTIAADTIGRAVDIAVYTKSDHLGWVSEPGIVGYLASATFVNEFWLTSLSPGSNFPVWSLSYEFAYYLIFGAAALLSGRARVAVLALLLCAIGPKVLLLAPAWFLGVVLFRAIQSGARSPWPAVVAFAAGPIVYAVLKIYKLDVILLVATDIIVPVSSQTLRYASNFIWLNVVGVLVAVHLYGAMRLGDVLQPLLTPFRRLIKSAADVTLSIYLTHMPVMMLLSAVLHPEPSDPLKNAAIVAITLAIGIIFGHLFEGTRHSLRRNLDAVAARLNSGWERVAHGPRPTLVTRQPSAPCSSKMGLGA